MLHGYYSVSDMSYSQLLKPRPEVLSDQGIDGIIDLANLFSKKKKALEKDAERFLALTYPTGDIRRVLEELDRRFNSEKTTSGLFLFEGLKGTGKSHLLLLIYHLLQNREASREWLRKHTSSAGCPTIPPWSSTSLPTCP
jgi:predicted ATPase